MRFILLSILLAGVLQADLTVDLREPLLENGVVSTSKGGVITAPRFRMQAQNIAYTKNKGEHFVQASCFVMVDFGDYIFVGDSLYYDFQTETGVIERGTSRDLPWFFGGDRIELCSDGSYVIKNAFITTAETIPPDWQIRADEVVLNRCRTVDASGVKLRLFRLPDIWLPSFKFNLSSLTEAPLHFYGRWGGKQGVRCGLKYSLFDLNGFKTFLRVDWRVKRGLGGGIETYYASEDGKHSLETINYYAHDNSLENLNEKVRYRFQGIYKNSLYDDKISVYASWDKLSDKDMATDYNDQGLELDTAGRTELLARKEDPWWITNFSSRLRINDFQTVKEELPSLLFNQRPYVLGKSGILVENQIEASYLEYRYANDVLHVPDYDSPRLLHEFRLLRPFHPRPFNLTPQVGLTTAVYGNSPAHNSKFLVLGYGGLSGNTACYQTFGNFKQIISPYFEWKYLSAPTVNPHDHYVFDIEDGLWRLNSFRVGARQDILVKTGSEGQIHRLVELDLFSYLFVDSAPISKLYGNLTWRSWPNVKHTLQSAWDFSVNQLDHLNFNHNWTVSDDCALSCEWRHRSRYSWRKAVWNNYILDSFHTTQSLLHSSVSTGGIPFFATSFGGSTPCLPLNSRRATAGFERRNLRIPNLKSTFWPVCALTGV